jgi:sugar fermentation stimulation protein A
MSEAVATGGDLVDARFVARPNRFVVEAVVERGRKVRAHLADPGRLTELLVEGAPLRLRPVAARPGRRTRFTAVLVRASTPPHPWVSVDTTLPNRLAETLLRRNEVPGVGAGWSIRREVTVDRSRFDFMLSRNDERMVVEVKSVTLVEDGIARFPDAPTARGARHVREIEDLVREGARGLVLFIVQRSDARAVATHEKIDPDFADAVRSAHTHGVLFRAAHYTFDANVHPTHKGPLPIHPQKGTSP